jgi:hypothetical protein
LIVGDGLIVSFPVHLCLGVIPKCTPFRIEFVGIGFVGNGFVGNGFVGKGFVENVFVENGFVGIDLV